MQVSPILPHCLIRWQQGCQTSTCQLSEATEGWHLIGWVTCVYRDISMQVSPILPLVTTFITCRTRRSISYLWKCTQAPGQILTQMTLMVSYFTEKIWNTQQGHVLYYLIQLCRCTVPPLSCKILYSSFWVKTTICEHFKISIEMKIRKYISGIASGSNFPTPVPLKCQLVKKQMNLYKWGET